MDSSFYDACSLSQASVHTLAAPMFRAAARAAARAAERNGDPYIRILVVGAATGANDIAALKNDVLPVMRAHTSIPIHFLFADLPSNDFTALLAEAEDLDDGDRTWATAKVGYASEPIIGPAASVHLVMCISMLHWQQSPPRSAMLRREISYVTLPPSPKQEMRVAADAELERFFVARMKELCPGGQIVAVFDGESADREHQFARTYYLLEEGLKSMINDELLPEQFLTHYFIPTVSYSADRIEAVLERTGGLVAEATFLDVPCQYQLAWEQDRDHTKHGKAVAGATLAYARHNLLKSMAECNVPEEAREKLLETLRLKMAIFAAGAPTTFHTAGITAFLQVAKPAEPIPSRLSRFGAVALVSFLAGAAAAAVVLSRRPG